jgi:sugar lactone lactonase YvrE
MIKTSSANFKAAAVTALIVAAVLLASILLGGCAAKPKAAPQKSAAFWPQYPDAPRVQFLTSIGRSSDVEPAKSKLDELVLGKETQQVLPLSKPYGLEMWDGKIYACDIRNNSITIFDLRNHRTLIMGKSGPEPLERPTDIAIAPDGMKYVTDLDKGKIAVFDSQDRQISSFVVPSMKPVAVAVFQDELYVCDFARQIVLVLDRSTGQYRRAIGKPGTNDGEFIRPLGIDVDAQGNVYVMDVFKCQLQKFDRGGKLITKFGSTSANAGGFVRPKQVAVDREGMIYVTDAAFQNVQVFDQQGRPLTFFGSAGSHPGAMYLPAGICIHEGDLDLFKQYIHPAFDAQRLVLVTNQFGDNKISVYALGQLAAGKTVADISASKDVVPAVTGDKRAGPAALSADAAPPPDELQPNTTPAANHPTTVPAAVPSASSASPEAWQKK